MTKKALIIGATGATGKELVNQLLADDEYHEVAIFVRKAPDILHPKLVVHLTDFDHLDKVADHIKGDVLYSALGTTLKQAGSKENQWKIDHDYQLNFAKIAQQNGVATLAIISANEADADSRIFYARLKGSLEQEIVKLGFPKTLIFRPSLLKRPHSDRFAESVGEKVLEFTNRFGILTAHKPLPTKDLAVAMRKAVAQQKTGIIDKDEIWRLAQH